MTVTLPPLLVLLGMVFMVLFGAAAGLLVSAFMVAMAFDRFEWPWPVLALPPIAGAAGAFYWAVLLL